jgi:peptidoglycan hydrolase CwlO-like protein
MSTEDMNANMATTENENIVAESNNELEELRESNANLIAEREQLKDKIEELEAKIKREKEDFNRVCDWYKREQDKVRSLKIIIVAMMIIYTIVERIAEAV